MRIEPAMAAFVEGPVMMVCAVRTPDGRAAIARAVGARVSPAGDAISIVVSKEQWPEVVACLAPGAPAAFTACRPSDYRTFQFKGPIAAVRPADEADRAASARYVAGVVEVLGGLGVTDAQMRHWIGGQDLVALTLRPQSVFVQTPGPEAGLPLEPAAA